MKTRKIIIEIDSAWDITDHDISWALEVGIVGIKRINITEA